MADSLAFTETCPDTKYLVQYWYGYWVTWVQPEEEQHGQNGKIGFCYNSDKK